MQYGHWIVISSDLVPQLLRMFFNFPNFETMMYKAHPFNFQELEHTFSQAKKYFQRQFEKERQNLLHKNVSMQTAGY